MYARVTFAQAQPGELQKTIGLLRDTLYPAFKEMEGFQGAYLLTNPGEEKVCGITLWESEDSIPRVTQTAVEDGGHATRRFFEAPPLEQLATIPLAGQPGREIYQVAARLSSPGPLTATRARVLTAQVMPGAMDRVYEIARDLAQDAIGRQPGFRYSLALTQLDNGAFLAVTLWESEAHAVDWETGCKYRRQITKMTPLLDGSPRMDCYDVSVCI